MYGLRIRFFSFGSLIICPSLWLHVQYCDLRSVFTVGVNRDGEHRMCYCQHISASAAPDYRELFQMSVCREPGPTSCHQYCGDYTLKCIRAGPGQIPL